MDLAELCIEINVRSGVTEPKGDALEINGLAGSSTPFSIDASTTGFGLGMAWGGALVFLGLIAMMTGLGAGLVELLGYVHIGYEATIFGVFKGGIMGFLYGFICGAVLSITSNTFLARRMGA